MQDLIVIGLAGMAALAAVACAFLRRGDVRAGNSSGAGEVNGGQNQPIAIEPDKMANAKVMPGKTVPVGMAERPQREMVSVQQPGPSREASFVPNTTIAPLPEDRTLATLDFDGPPGQVAIRRGETVIGRHSEADVRLTDVRVSRRHARLIAHSNGRFQIENLTAQRDEPNAMLVNGQRQDNARIGDGDVVSLGGVSFRLRLVNP